MGMTEYGYEDEWNEHWGIDKHRTAGSLGLKNSGGDTNWDSLSEGAAL